MRSIFMDWITYYTEFIVYSPPWNAESVKLVRSVVQALSSSLNTHTERGKCFVFLCVNSINSCPLWTYILRARTKRAGDRAQHFALTWFNNWTKKWKKRENKENLVKIFMLFIYFLLIQCVYLWTFEKTTTTKQKKIQLNENYYNFLTVNCDFSIFWNLNQIINKNQSINCKPILFTSACVWLTARFFFLFTQDQLKWACNVETGM